MRVRLCHCTSTCTYNTKLLLTWQLEREGEGLRAANGQAREGQMKEEWATEAGARWGQGEVVEKVRED